MKNLALFGIVFAFLLELAQANKLSAQMKSDMMSNKIVLDDQVLEIKKEISGGGIIDLIDGTSDRIDGINTFDKDRLRAGRLVIFDKVAINYATDAASGKEGSLEYNTKAPAALQNATLIISQDGREVLRMPFRDVHNIHTADTESKEYTQLNSLRYLLDDRQVTVQLKFPPNVALDGGAKHYVYFRAKGLQTAKKASE